MPLASTKSPSCNSHSVEIMHGGLSESLESVVWKSSGKP